MGGGERGKEMRKNAKKWKDLARESSKEGGSSYQNLQDFFNEIGGGAMSLDIKNSVFRTVSNQNPFKNHVGKILTLKFLNGWLRFFLHLK
jgi:hypothetical protein